MKFYVISCSDSSATRAEIPGAVWLARSSSVVGDGPNSHYLYRRLFAHAGDPDLSDVSRVYDCVGRSRYVDPVVAEVSRAQAQQFAREGKPLAPTLADFPTALRDRVASAPGSYDARNGGRSPGSDTRFFIDLLDDYDSAAPVWDRDSPLSFTVLSASTDGREIEVGRFGCLPDALASIESAAKNEGVDGFGRILSAPYGRYRYEAWVSHRGNVTLDYCGVA